MKKHTITVLALLMSLFFVGCQKETSQELSSATSRGLLGNYKFISMEAQAITSMQTTAGADVEKSVSKAQYITKNNTGTIKFDVTTISSSDMSYAVDTTVTGYFYTNGILQDSATMPFAVSMPPFSSTAPYKLVGADSIYFSSGSLFMEASTSMSSATKPSGSKLRFDGNKLFITSSYNEAGTREVQGMQVYSTIQALTIVTLEKL
jgi:hypothetical protein